MQSVNSAEFIQQWQYVGKVSPKLLEDRVFEYCKEVGLTSLQSYVYWAEIEKEPDKIDFSSYDVLVEKLAKHGLKWVPFLILGPNYATPKWFQDSEERVFAKCLEHKKESKIQSIWNPHLSKYVDRFLYLVAEHYQDRSILESIGLGISGNWGESIYPANGGFYGGFHTHRGWWCGDEYAIANFRKFIIEKYESLRALNNSYNTNLNNLDEIGFPPLRQSSAWWWDCAYRIYVTTIPRQIRRLVRPAYRFVNPVLTKASVNVKKSISSLRRKVSESEQEKWLDFVNWYFASMTNWAEFWVKTARKYFQNSKIYLVTGGDGNPMLGADFSAQTKMVKKYDAGIRITNQSDDYEHSFIVTRLVSSAARFYDTYFTTEEAGINSPRGVVMRLFDVVTSGARGAYFKNIIGIGSDICTGHTSTIGEPTQGAVKLSQNLHHLTFAEPVIDVAVLFPYTSINFDPSILKSVYYQCSKLRDVLDFDLVDENMIEDGSLKKYRFLLLLDGNLMQRGTFMKIEEWLKAGGILISSKYITLSAVREVIGWYQGLFSNYDGIERIGEGYVLLYCGREENYLEFIRQAIHNEEKTYPWDGIPEIDNQWDGVYATRFSDRVIYYNSTNSRIRKKVKIKNLLKKLEFEIDIEANSIISMPLGKDRAASNYNL